MLSETEQFHTAEVPEIKQMLENVCALEKKEKKAVASVQNSGWANQ